MSHYFLFKFISNNLNFSFLRISYLLTFFISYYVYINYKKEKEKAISNGHLKERKNKLCRQA